MNFSANAVLVKTERGHAPPKRASFADPYDVFDPDGGGYANTARGTMALNVRTEKTNIPRKRLVPPGDGRFFDHFH